MLDLFSTCTRRRPAPNARIIGRAWAPTSRSLLFSRVIFTVHLPRRLRIVVIGHLHDDVIYYYDHNSSGFCFFVQIRAFVI